MQDLSLISYGGLCNGSDFIKNVSYRYPLEENQVIKNVSFEIEKGQVWGLIGANESGKTSICNIIRGFIPEIYRGELEGEVEIKGKRSNPMVTANWLLLWGILFRIPLHRYRE